MDDLTTRKKMARLAARVQVQIVIILSVYPLDARRQKLDKLEQKLARWAGKASRLATRGLLVDLACLVSVAADENKHTPGGKSLLLLQKEYGYIHYKGKTATRISGSS